ncbi:MULTISPECIES: RDD family protein [unclassified Thermosynechococcus]|uniref:RDD family protein n=1 Tax=unclassified Thermosynechococcus TaxID=2622553 RepID=UPI002872AE76|nr:MULTISPECIES: RDD family protein [unclassified Thermosynechococcus]WNC23211.1 RDD family protein [Thermosynechococcus sp. PP22]WNC33449.1 RDD family protein [Thermosynechococcus sp. PKX95]WNC35973.1 RDD family protein [Thermosynechococcus sp. PKX91]WNC38497.1 RDD family protein [Thermosynechococcus sp. WL11]WNC41016.1 RDD family protein [Thermosynechococcus sp. WL17]
MWPFRRRGRLPHSLSSGNVVTIALQLYRHQGNRYFLLSLFAHAWFFLLTIAAVLIVAVALIVGGILAGAMDNVAPFLGLTGISVLVALPFYLFGWTRLMASGALLSRRIYAVLTALEESESAARSFIFPKMLNYLLATLMVSVILLLVYGVLGAIGYLIYLVASPLVQFLEQNIQTEPARSLFFLTFLLSILLLVLLALLVISYFMARLSLVDVVLALEPDCTPLKSVRRSWQLTQGQAWHTLTVFFVASLATIPANLLGSIINSVVILPVAGLFVGVLLLPLWQGIKAVLYWDLRVRNEGAAFQVRPEAVNPLRWLRRVTLRTPESIELDFALAGIGSRVLAWLIDQVILYTALVLFSLAAGYIYFYALYPWLIEVLPASGQSIEAWSLGIYLLVMFAFYNGYYIFFETYWQGQTPGKRYAEIRVVQDNGRPIGLREATLRSLLQPIDFAFFGIGAFLVALSRSEKRLGDRVAGTLVIQDEQATRLAPKATTGQQPQAAWVQELRSLAHWEQMTPEHYLLVRNYLNNRDRLSPVGRYQAAQELRQQLEPLLLPTYPANWPALSAEDFLEGLYIAYRQQYQSSP